MSLLTTTAPGSAGLSHGGQPVSPDTAAAAPVGEAAAAAPADAGKRNPEPGNKYKAEVNALLDAYEKKQASKAKEAASAPEPEPAGLNEGESWDSVYSAQPPEVQRAMAELRKMVTRKTQELAREKQALQAQHQALASSGLLESLAQQAGKMPQDFDPFNAEHIQAAIDAKVAAKLKEVLEPLGTQQRQREAATRYETFKAENPDLVADPEIKSGVFAALQADKNLSLEAAYWMVKGKRLSAQQSQQQQQAEVRRRAMQRAAVIGDRGAKPGREVVSADVRSGNAWDIYQALKKSKA
jgi:hypothetical protein